MFYVTIIRADERIFHCWLTTKEVPQRLKEWSRDETIDLIKMERSKVGVLVEGAL